MLRALLHEAISLLDGDVPGSMKPQALSWAVCCWACSHHPTMGNLGETVALANGPCTDWPTYAILPRHIGRGSSGLSSCNSILLKCGPVQVGAASEGRIPPGQPGTANTACLPPLQPANDADQEISHRTPSPHPPDVPHRLPATCCEPLKRGHVEL